MTQPNVFNDASADKAEILELETRRFQAVVDGDFDTFSSLCHPDMVYTHSNGARDSVDSYLDKCRSGFYVYHRIDHPVHDVILIGDTAVVIGQMNATLTAAGIEKELVNSSMSVWVRESGRWLLLAYQPTPLASRPATS